MPAGISLKYIKARPFDELPFRIDLIREGSKIVKEQEKDFIKTVRKWKMRPTWIRKVDHSDAAITVEVYTENEIYGYVDKGTKKHIIVPRNKTVLKFRGGSYSGRGRPKKSDYVYTKLVHHPGFKGYKHSETIAKKWQPLIRTRFDAAIKQAAKSSGHSYK